MLAEKMQSSHANCWLINTGWTGGKFGTGKRCPLKYTRAIVDAIHNGQLAKAEFENFPVFNLSIPKAVEGVPSEILHPAKVWPSQDAFKEELQKLGGMFQKAYAKYEADVDHKIKLAGPVFE